MAEIIDNEKLPWPSRLADFSYNCVKWGLLTAAVGIPSGLILSLIIKGFGDFLGGVCFAIGLGSFLIGLISSSIALFGMLLYRFKIYGTGRALGIFVLTFCGFSIGWAIVQPALLNAKRLSEQVLCESHIKGLSSALRMYSYENNGQYPTPEKWSELILEHSGSFNEKTFWCRAESKGTYSYAINEYLYQTESNEASSDIVLLFEAVLGRNGLGSSEDLELRHQKGGKTGCYISFVDGHVEFIEADDIPNLRWTVEEE